MKKLRGVLFIGVLAFCMLFPATSFAAAGDVSSISAKVGGSEKIGFSAGTYNYDALVNTEDTLTVEANADFSNADSSSYIKISCGLDMASSGSGNISLNIPNIDGNRTVVVETYYAPDGSPAVLVSTYTINVGIKAQLKSIDVKFNGISQTITWDVNRYKVTTPVSSGTITVSAQAENGGTVNIASANQSFTLDADEAREIVIEITSPTGDQQSYDLLVHRPIALPSDNNLSGLTLSHNGSVSSSFPIGGNWNRSFSYSITSYNITVATNATSVQLNPSLSDSLATYTINSGGKTYTAGQSIPVASGTYTTIIIQVRAQNGATKSYTLNVSRGNLSDNCELSNLYLRYSGSSLDMFPKFSSESSSTYYAFVRNSVSSVQVYASSSDRAASIYVNGTKINSGSYTSVSVSSTSTSGNRITVEVIAQDGISKRTYDIIVRRASSSASSDADLDDITIRSGSSGSTTIGYSPSFAYNTYTYDAYVDTSVKYVRILPEVSTRGAVVLVDGELVVSPSQTYATSGSISLSSGTTKINVVVYAPDFSKKNTYVVNLNRGNSTNNYLSTFSIREPKGTVRFTPSFSRTSTSYYANVANDVTKLSLLLMPEDASASIKVNNTSVASNSWTPYINLAEGDNNISVTVTSVSGTKRIYNIIVTRAKVTIAKNVKLKIGQKTATLGTEQITIDAVPFLHKFGKNNYTMVPLRFIAQSLGADVNYHGNTTYMITIALKNKKITMYANGKADIAAGMDVPPVIINGRTYVPLRYVGEQLNAVVNWNQTDQSITIIPN